LADLEGGRTQGAELIYGTRLHPREARVAAFTVDALGPGAIAALAVASAGGDSVELSRRVFLMVTRSPLALIRHVSRAEGLPICTAMREVFGRLDEDGVVGDQGEDSWQWRADFVSDALALLGFPLPELPEHEEDAPEDVSDSPVDDGDDVLGGDDDLREVDESYAEWVASRKAQNKSKRRQWQGARGRRRRAVAAQHMRAAQEECARPTDERCTRRRANHFAGDADRRFELSHLDDGAVLPGVLGAAAVDRVHGTERNDPGPASAGVCILRTVAGVSTAR
jgi:hypothetical protein